MRYQTLLFDVDDTLLDFQLAEKEALQALFKENGLPLTEEIEARYKAINQGLWQAFEKEEISREEVLSTRFSRLFHSYGRQVDGIWMERQYREHLENGHAFVEGAEQLIPQLAEQFRLYIVTNGVSKTQYKRLNDANLTRYFEDIFVSEDTGYQKPMAAYFDYCFARIPNFQRAETLIIGDSITSDIQGGQNAGLDTVWFNPQQKKNGTDIRPSYEIAHLQELNQVLGL
ncbi:YjjG family noncanonical pyrimidine nucleotidase [Listeria costaricensis]|uniref:YjjG family noncanonical pyrimidine nucleotidase n=1 Tax=Listeria costaricensis TaxID=2026604 RepID=UPI000C07DC8E|nr:YjjG family noncanonical pyrimidine nucleotidase [Listeria costaricensis]